MTYEQELGKIAKALSVTSDMELLVLKANYPMLYQALRDLEITLSQDN